MADQKRVFKTRTFDRWARKAVSGDLLCAAAREIEQGRYEGDLGGGVCKKRIALPGKGKSGSTRTLVAHRYKLAIIFLAGRRKNEPGGDFSASEEQGAKVLAKSLQLADRNKLNLMKCNGILKEICDAQ